MKLSEIKFVVVSNGKIEIASTYDEAVELVKDIYDSTCGPAWVFQKMHTIVDGKDLENVYILDDEDFAAKCKELEAKYGSEMASESNQKD